jgi:NAD(P)-dependent dehydrogenase (short-subunit alcohol dehydrogenase family)
MARPPVAADEDTPAERVVACDLFSGGVAVLLSQKTVVVTGVGPGLGSEIARASLREGANVVLAARTAAKLEQIAKDLDPSGRRVAAIAADIGDDASCAHLVSESEKRFSRIDALVQVAALDAVFGTLEQGSFDDWRRAYDINVVGSARIARAAAASMAKTGGGSIVLIGTQAAFLPSTAQIAYGASKGALKTAMYYMAKELGPKKIRVNTVVPTWMWGPPVEAYVKMMAKQRGVSTDVVVGEITARMPLGEIPQDADVAEAVVFFCSDRARMISGQYLMVNAGELMT